MKQHVVKSGWTAKGIGMCNEFHHAIKENRKDCGADFDKAFMQHITDNASCESNKQKNTKRLLPQAKNNL